MASVLQYHNNILLHKLIYNFGVHYIVSLRFSTVFFVFCFFKKKSKTRLKSVFHSNLKGVQSNFGRSNSLVSNTMDRWNYFAGPVNFPIHLM